MLEKDPNGLLEIKKILRLERKYRTHEQRNVLIRYFKKLEVFKNLDAEAFQHLTGAVESEDVNMGHDIIVEGDKGDTFYIILDGQVEVLKAQMVPIKGNPKQSGHESDLDDEKRQQIMEAKVKAYFEAFR